MTSSYFKFEYFLNWLCVWSIWKSILIENGTPPIKNLAATRHNQFKSCKKVSLSNDFCGCVRSLIRSESIVNLTFIFLTPIFLIHTLYVRVLLYEILEKKVQPNEVSDFFERGRLFFCSLDFHKQIARPWFIISLPFCFVLNIFKIFSWMSNIIVYLFKDPIRSI